MGLKKYGYMKHIYIFLLFILFIQRIQAQTTTFVEGADMPASKSAMSSATDGNNIYVTNGFSLAGGYTSDVFKYDTINNTWNVLTNSTIAKRFGSAEIVGNDLFIFNGFVSNDVYNETLEVVDLTTGTVTNTGLINPQPAAVAGVTKEGNVIYSFGGNTATGYSNKLYALDTTTLMVTELASMPIAAETKGEIVNGKLYVIGGYNGNVSDKIYVYDIATNIWTNQYTLPQGLSANATAVVGTDIYVVGDFSDQTFTGYFNTITNTFTETTSNLLGRRHAVAEGVNGELYVMGGNTTSSGSSALASLQSTNNALSIEIYDEDHFTIYPNPVSNLLNISKKVDKLTLLSIAGTIIREDTNTNQLDVHNLQNGIYFLSLERENNIQTLKFVKQ